ncbi:hypothetical protein [Anaerospora hongkongensis]|uniref:hypothetical protein n=1 Tax=Anaerospora hongkongensis TaxID=244830 RepID=UPI002FDB6265
MGFGDWIAQIIILVPFIGFICLLFFESRQILINIAIVFGGIAVLGIIGFIAEKIKEGSGVIVIFSISMIIGIYLIHSGNGLAPEETWKITPGSK